MPVSANQKNINSGTAKAVKYSWGQNSKLLEHIASSSVVQASQAVAGSNQALEMSRLLHASLAASTWARYESGFRAYVAFEQHVGCQLPWPLSKEALRSFVTYCIRVKKIKAIFYKNLSLRFSPRSQAKRLHRIFYR